MAKWASSVKSGNKVVDPIVSVLDNWASQYLQIGQGAAWHGENHAETNNNSIARAASQLGRFDAGESPFARVHDGLANALVSKGRFRSAW